MGLFLGIVFALLGILGWLFFMYAAGMAPNPGANPIATDTQAEAWAILLIFMVLAALCFATHYFPLHW